MKRTKMSKVVKSILFTSMIGSYGAVNAGDQSEGLYYQIGGAAPFSVSAGRGFNPNVHSIGVRWNANSSCNGFDLGFSVSNQLNGLSNGFQNLMGNVVQNATSAVAALPAMIIQRTNPGLYDLMQNGVLQARMDFDRSKLSCQSMANAMADKIVGGGWHQAASSQAWSQAAQTHQDPVQAQEAAEARSGNEGVRWVGGQNRGGQGQEPIRVVRDIAQAGYNLLHRQPTSTTNAPITGGGGGWGSVPTGQYDWTQSDGGEGLGGGSGSGGSGATANCFGGMCTIWRRPSDAADWITRVIGDVEARTCDDCEIQTTIAGTGLAQELEREQLEVYQNLVNLVSGSQPITPDALQAVSAGDGFVVSRSVIEALRADPAQQLLTHRLASEIALARVLTKAIWARRTLMAGASEPGVSGYEEGERLLNRKMSDLDRDIQTLKTEMEIRQMLSDSVAITALNRQMQREARSMPIDSIVPDGVLDPRGAPISE